MILEISYGYIYIWAGDDVCIEHVCEFQDFRGLAHQQDDCRDFHMAGRDADKLYIHIILYM